LIIYFTTSWYCLPFAVPGAFRGIDFPGFGGYTYFKTLATFCVPMSKKRTAKHYDNYAHRYEHRWKGYLNTTHGKLLEVLLPGLEESDTILDVSCGTGLLAAQLLEREAPFRELVLNDISPRMLGIAQKRLPNDRRISFTAWPAEALQFDDNRFTKIICLNAFHNYDHPSVAARQFKNVLTPNGRLYLLDWNRSRWFRLVNTFIRWTGGENINTMSLNEATRLLRQHDYSISYTDRWSYRYWRFFIVVGGFQPWRSSV